MTITTCAGLTGNEQNIDEVDLGVLLEVVPVPVVLPLPQELDGWLGSVDLPRWHVQIVNKYNLGWRGGERKGREGRGGEGRGGEGRGGKGREGERGEGKGGEKGRGRGR